MTDNVQILCQKYKEEIDAWMKQLSFSINEPNRSEIEEILNMKTDKIKTKSSKELKYMSFALSQYSLFLQYKFNECNTFMRWANRIIRNLCYEDKARINTMINKADVRMSMIDSLSRKIDNISISINMISKL